jgi:hypothetical protein
MNCPLCHKLADYRLVNQHFILDCVSCKLYMNLNDNGILDIRFQGSDEIPEQIKRWFQMKSFW